MRRVRLTKGAVALVDDADYRRFACQKWCLLNEGNKGYAVRRKKGGGLLLMHRVILRAPPSVTVDHKNGNGLDNRRTNLRFATRRQQAMNKRKARGAASKWKGVYQLGRGWMAKITARGKQRYLGLFPTEEEAARAYRRAARKYFGQFARLQ